MCGNYCKREFNVQNLNLEHESAQDFYISCWQRNRAILPLLCTKAVIFLGCLAIVLASVILTSQSISFGYWPIYMTHWGIIFITITSGLSFAVSCRAYIAGPIDSTFKLPWYVKAYWAFFNAAVPVALFITVFYYVFLSSLVEEFAVNPTLDFFIHGANSILMLALLLLVRHPYRWMHFYWSLTLGIIYLLFSLIYYYAGGTDPFGNSYIYPMLDWSRPGPTVGMALGSAVAIFVMHALVVGIATLRDDLTRRYRRDSNSITIHEPYN